MTGTMWARLLVLGVLDAVSWTMGRSMQHSSYSEVHFYAVGSLFGIPPPANVRLATKLHVRIGQS